MGKLHVMIVSPPGAWRRVLQKNLETYSFVKIIDVVSGGLSASQRASLYKPDLILIDSSIPLDDAAALVRNIKHNNPSIRSLVITDTSQQRRIITQSGADYTLSSYDYEDQIGKLLQEIKRLILEVQDSSETSYRIDRPMMN